ncbi:hypothetical protein Y1Q_0008033 [Alligator mississippiensis]|uniref:Uncharacterized protein n=1 Tax=Alligator mississippiensis TaxID=8496 RepID=A0A151NFB3_ALLMI|nr:hypothetical protein Y1Q_0008033 [Alligator mississippiensis]
MKAPAQRPQHRPGWLCEQAGGQHPVPLNSAPKVCSRQIQSQRNRERHIREGGGKEISAIRPEEKIIQPQSRFHTSFQERTFHHFAHP